MVISSIVASLAILASQGAEKSQIPKGLLDGLDLKSHFNASKNRVRLMFIFAPS